MSDTLVVLTIVTALGSGVAAGVFFAFSTFVMAALGRVPASEGIRAMQEINITVINPWFMTALFGPALACVAVIVAALVDWDGSYGPYLVAAAVLYLVGCIGVTMAANVPHNNELARLDPSLPEAAPTWRRYLVQWTAWNSVRTVASLATTAALIAAIAAD